MQTQLSAFQLQLCELQFWKFWKLVSKNKFHELKDFALKMHSMFGSTYVCKSTFSTMKLVKSRNKNRIINQTLDNCLRLSNTSIDIDIETIMPEKPQTHASH